MTYIVVQDESCHWYVIPSDKENEFNALAEDEETYSFPDWAVRVGGALSLVKFTGYTIA